MTHSERSLAVVMDPIEDIQPAKDTTLGILEAAMRRGWHLRYFTPRDLYLRDGQAWGLGRDLTVSLDTQHWFEYQSDAYPQALDTCAAILLRTDPPVDLEYLYTCHILGCAQANGAVVVNNPAGIQLCNEKIFSQTFAELCPPTLVSKNNRHIGDFIAEYQDVVIKPLNQMGGQGIARLDSGSFTRPDELDRAIDSATQGQSRTMMVQKLIPDYADGDKRILIVGGKAVPYGLLRIPAPGQFCANLAAGGFGEGVELTERDHAICERIGQTLVDMDLLFVGIDVVGGYLTEINVTSPTCMREINSIYDLDVGTTLMKVIESRLAG